MEEYWCSNWYVYLIAETGLSAYVTDPKVASNSLMPLLEKAKKVVPQDMRQNTPVKVGVSDFYD